MRKLVKPLALLLILCVSVAFLSSCASNNNNTSKVTVTDTPTKEEVAKATEVATEKPTTKPTATPKKTTTSSSKSSSSSSRTSFTNKYGTATTKCAHPGCNNYIASSGDTNCCTTHSRRCLECNKYIDEDAMYCMDCIKKALGK